MNSVLAQIVPKNIDVVNVAGDLQAQSAHCRESGDGDHNGVFQLEVSAFFRRQVEPDHPVFHRLVFAEMSHKVFRFCSSFYELTNGCRIHRCPPCIPRDLRLHKCGVYNARSLANSLTLVNSLERTQICSYFGTRVARSLSTMAAVISPKLCAVASALRARVFLFSPAALSSLPIPGAANWPRRSLARIAGAFSLPSIIDAMTQLRCLLRTQCAVPMVGAFQYRLKT